MLDETLCQRFLFSQSSLMSTSSFSQSLDLRLVVRLHNFDFFSNVFEIVCYFIVCCVVKYVVMANFAQMIVPYQWILNIDEKEPMTITSKMILFRGERVFRVGLKNHAQSPILLFLAADLNRLGMRVEDVKYGIEYADTCPSEMTQMKREDQIGIDGSLQLFTINLFKMVTGQRTFVFRICIKGTDPGYSYQLSDRLAKDQLWATVKNQLWTDVEFIVKGKKLSANKAILAARSEVFAAEFDEVLPPVVREGRHQIRIDGVEPSTVENFLHFVYTGEPMSSLANEQLLMLAEKYRLTTLTSLCQVALKKIETKQMVDFMKSFNMGADEIPPPSQIRPEKDTEIFFDRTTPTFRCALTFNNRNFDESQCMMQYHNEDIFFAYYKQVRGKESCGFSTPYSFLVHFSCAKRRNFGFKIEDIYVGSKGYDWNKMKAKNSRENPEVCHFIAQFPKNESPISFSDHVFEFDIKIVSTTGNYYYEMMDDKWLKDLWAAARDQKLTDVDIFIGTDKVMEAHRIILSARSPVLNIVLNKVSNNATKSIVYFREEFTVNVVINFLRFLYTGSLEKSASKAINYKQLLELATIYEVETLKNFCQVVNAFVPLDVEDLTSSLLEL